MKDDIVQAALYWHKCRMDLLETLKASRAERLVLAMDLQYAESHLASIIDTYKKDPGISTLVCPITDIEDCEVLSRAKEAEKRIEELQADEELRAYINGLKSR